MFGWITARKEATNYLACMLGMILENHANNSNIVMHTSRNNILIKIKAGDRDESININCKNKKAIKIIKRALKENTDIK